MLIGLMLAAGGPATAGPISNAYGARDVFTSCHSPFLLVAVMFVPALDMLLAIVRRTRGAQPFSPDKMHLHHRLCRSVTPPPRVLLIYLWVGLIAFGAASTIFVDPRYIGAVMLATVIAGVVTCPAASPRGRTSRLIRGDGFDDDDELTGTDRDRVYGHPIRRATD